MNTEQIKDLILTIGGDPWSKMVTFLPNLVGAILILVVGYIISKTLQRAGGAVLRRLGFDRLSARVGLDRFFQRGGLKTVPSALIGHLLFWLFMLTFLISAAETLGLSNVSRTIESMVMYLPNVIAAVVIFIVGITLAAFVRGVIQSAAESIGVDYAQALAKVAYGALVIVSSTLAIGQLQIETSLLNRIIQIVLIGAAAAVAFALGTGTRDIARHLVAGVYLRDIYQAGTRISVGEHTGSLEEVGPVVTRLRTGDGTFVNIPNAQLTEAVVQEQSTRT
jgi:small-conductance mechanosensitive channel